MELVDLQINHHIKPNKLSIYRKYNGNAQAAARCDENLFRIPNVIQQWPLKQPRQSCSRQATSNPAFWHWTTASHGDACKQCEAIRCTVAAQLLPIYKTGIAHIVCMMRKLISSSCNLSSEQMRLSGLLCFVFIDAIIIHVLCVSVIQFDHIATIVCPRMARGDKQCHHICKLIYDLCCDRRSISSIPITGLTSIYCCIARFFVDC